MWFELAPKADPFVLSLAAGGGLLVLGLLIRRSVRRAGAGKTTPAATVGTAAGSPQPLPQATRQAFAEVQRAPVAIATPAAAAISFADAFAPAPTPDAAAAPPLAPARAAAPGKPSSTAAVQPLPSAAAVAATMAAAEAARARKRT